MSRSGSRHRTYEELQAIQNGIANLLLSPTNNNAEDRKYFMRVEDILHRKMYLASIGCQDHDECK